MARDASTFFDSYAGDFDAIYGGNRGLVGRVIDRLLRRSMRLRFDRTVAGCHPVVDRTVLDVGCGPGHYGVTLARRGARRVTGIDVAPEMIRIAMDHAARRGVAERCEFLVAAFEDFAPDEPFDYCVVMGVLDYVAEPVPFLLHAREVTTGRVFVSFPKAGGLLAAQRRVRYRWKTPLYLYRRQKLTELLSAVAPDAFHIGDCARDFFVEMDGAAK